MAAVFTSTVGLSECESEGISSENNIATENDAALPILISATNIKVEDTSEDPGYADPSRRQAAATDVAPLASIKEERVEDEDYVQIQLGDVGSSSENIDQSGTHNDSAHVMVSSMKCEDCGEQFANWDASKIHQCQHDKSKETRRNMKRKDVLLHTESKQKAGDDCEGGEQDHGGKEEVCLAKLTDAVETDSLVALQVEEKKPIYGTSQKVYVCGICGKVYSYLESFRNHHKQHRDKCEKPNQFTCVYCGKQYRHASGLSCHMKVHKNDNVPSALKCDQCNKIFHSHQTWSTHREIHRKKPFWCLSCAKGFKDSKGLDRHLLGHDLKRHKCDVCSKTFRVPAELRYHYNTHTGAKPYSCALCRKTFSQLGNLITHRKKHVRVYKEGSMTPLGSKPRQLAGKRRVSVLKKLIVTGAGELEEASAGVSENPEEVTDEEGMEAEIDECPDEQEEQLRCHECSALFSRESDLHQHYMKHASGEM